MRWRGRAATLATTTLLLAAAVPTAAATNWSYKIRKIEKQIEKSEWKKALDKSNDVLEKMVAEVDEAQTTVRPAAEVYFLQAIAEANLGQDDAALWHWFVAQNHLDDLASLDLSAYGRAQDLLAGRSLEDPPEVPALAPPATASRPPGYKEVKIQSTRRPTYPDSLRKSGMQGHVQVRVVVGTDGRPRQPLIQDAGLVPTMAYPALEALQSWKFVPAQDGGRAVPVYYEIRLEYR